MRNRNAAERCCSYVAILEHAAASGSELRDLATYLSTLGVANCDVIILDASPRLQFELNGRILRWVGRHVAVRPEFRTPGGATDITRAAAALAACEKVIVAADDVRYTPEAIGQLCDLLDAHEVVEPQDYLEPLPWWGGIDAGRILVHRGIEPQPDHGATYAFRRSTVRAMRALGSSEVYDDQVRRLAAVGAEVHAATDVFVRRQPAPLGDWLSARPRLAGDDFALPMKTAFFFSLMPMLLLLAAAGGLRLAGGYAGVIAMATIGLALRGRAGAAAFFPLRAALFAPLWVFERSVSVYWALYRKLCGVEADPLRVAIPDARERVASGE
ncbi:MAG: hypothetical protein JO197_18520 [Acidobacteria bacterium]|nr:hypothetical protein [Acidobacteriota bacterium]MBV9479099.1 hypothetical protein [Acidobacteriota bacterium]